MNCGLFLMKHSVAYPPGHGSQEDKKEKFSIVKS